MTFKIILSYLPNLKSHYSASPKCSPVIFPFLLSFLPFLSFLSLPFFPFSLLSLTFVLLLLVWIELTLKHRMCVRDHARYRRYADELLSKSTVEDRLANGQLLCMMKEQGSKTALRRGTLHRLGTRGQVGLRAEKVQKSQ